MYFHFMKECEVNMERLLEASVEKAQEVNVEKLSKEVFLNLTSHILRTS